MYKKNSSHGGSGGYFKMAGDGFLEHVDRKETEEHVFVRATG